MRYLYECGVMLSVDFTNSTAEFAMPGITVRIIAGLLAFTPLLMCTGFALSQDRDDTAVTQPVEPAYTHCPEPEARQFDFWTGQWDVTNRYLVNNAEWADIGFATNLVHPVLDGCAIVEHWRGNLGRNQIRGFSIRTYDPTIDRWVLLLSWPGPNRPSFSFLEGSFRHGRGEFFRDGVNAEGDSISTRYTFADVTPTSLRWDAASSSDGGIHWATNWIMEFSRRDGKSTDPVMNAPSYSLHRCTERNARSLDDLFGVWESTDTISMEHMPILEGCGAMQSLTVIADDRTYRAFLFFSPSATDNQWSAFLLSTTERSFVSLTGERSGDRVTLRSDDGHVLNYEFGDSTQVDLEASLPGLPEVATGRRSLTRR